MYYNRGRKTNKINGGNIMRKLLIIVTILFVGVLVKADEK